MVQYAGKTANMLARSSLALALCVALAACADLPFLRERTDEHATSSPQEEVVSEAPTTPATHAAGAIVQDPANQQNLVLLLTDLVHAAESPAAGDREAIGADLAAIWERDHGDGALARSVYAAWSEAFLQTESAGRLWEGPDTNTLLGTDAQDGPEQAFVVLGLELVDGEMAAELRLRLDAAADVARTYPTSALVCTGGATGANNPDAHTEAGLMRDYLVQACGIDAARIHIDETALTTVDNANNSLRIMQELGIERFSLITSVYHEPWARAVYGVASALYARKGGYAPRQTSDLSVYALPAKPAYAQGARIAALQIAELMHVPADLVLRLPQVEE